MYWIGLYSKASFILSIKRQFENLLLIGIKSEWVNVCVSEYKIIETLSCP